MSAALTLSAWHRLGAHQQSSLSGPASATSRRRINSSTARRRPTPRAVAASRA